MHHEPLRARGIQFSGGVAARRRRLESVGRDQPTFRQARASGSPTRFALVSRARWSEDAPPASKR